MTTQTARSAVPDADPLQPGFLSGGPGYFFAGAGTPVVMLHLSLSSKSQWTALAERLASRFRVIALDLYGYGDNAVAAAPASFTLDDEVRLVTAFCWPLSPKDLRAIVARTLLLAGNRSPAFVRRIHTLLTGALPIAASAFSTPATWDRSPMPFGSTPVSRRSWKAAWYPAASGHNSACPQPGRKSSPECLRFAP